MFIYCLTCLLLSFFNTVHVLGQERASVKIKASGPCGYSLLNRRGIKARSYRPAVAFNPREVEIDPPNPELPGCVKLIAKGVQLLRVLQEVTAEFELRISGSPNPDVPTLPCGKTLHHDECGCHGWNNSCVYCDFCKRMKSRQVRELKVNRVDRRSHRKSLKDILREQRLRKNVCDCDNKTKPGIYDIEAEICTPSADEMKKHIPPTIQNRIAEGKPISLFITIFIYDFRFHVNPMQLSQLGKTIFKQRRNQHTVGCFLVGTDVTVSRKRFWENK